MTDTANVGNFHSNFYHGINPYDFRSKHKGLCQSFMYKRSKKIVIKNINKTEIIF
ncbi:hypothetical protein HMPREF9145_1624 [Segatella salivae F0493]|uniref:Uncharacterized protein n=1 Tax=Segatella salivae F0493 TaxID=1395125 RepID=U2LEN4_9BACT|nr:hypothetical protein HMPREF9145_1624 [Segatella salivae F0493]